MTAVAPGTAKKRILFLCYQNSARSQMAEGLANFFYPHLLQGFSAGLEATRVHPYAVRAMAEIGADISSHRSKTMEEYTGQTFDYVVTLCDQAKQACPYFPGGRKYIHHSFADPAACRGNDQEIMDCFRSTREAIRAWIEATLLS